LTPAPSIALLLLAAVGLAFAVQNDKLPGLAWFTRRARAAVVVADAEERKPPRVAGFVVTGLRCTFCLGIHAGWILWLVRLIAWGSAPVTVADFAREIAALVIFAFASGVACYGGDELIAALERSGADS
jgi:hypothetical protein